MWWAIWCLGIAIICYACVCLFAAKLDVNKAPRREMFTCDKHSLFPAKYVIQLTGILDKPIQICPMCLEDRFKEAKEKLK